MVKAAGTNFAYAELGSGSPLLLLSGTGSPMSEWDPALLAQLKKSHRVLVFDYPGLGQSGPAPAKWSFPRAADWISQFLDSVIPNTPVDVLGWSMGGFIAQQLAIRHPARVRKLVLAGTNPGGARTELGPPWVQRIDSDADSSDQDYLKTNYPATASAQFAGRAFLHRLETAVSSGVYPVSKVPSATYEAMVNAEDSWIRSDANYRALPGLTHPTLVMTGTRDVVTPPANSRLIAHTIPQAELSLLPGAGHSFLFQNPKRTARAVDEFLHGQIGLQGS
ncbi:MAG: alpha/beta hydrolase [Actinomycetota bacterium]|nr:alpha/beta hydrolase [Actinomycetota bacterium]